WNQGGIIRLLDPLTGAELRHLDVGSPFFLLADLSSDRRMLAIGECMTGEVRLLRLETAQELHRFVAAERGSLISLTFSPDGTILLVKRLRGGVSLWNVATGKQLAHLADGFYSDGSDWALLAPGGKRFAMLHHGDPTKNEGDTLAVYDL